MGHVRSHFCDVSHYGPKLSCFDNNFVKNRFFHYTHGFVNLKCYIIMLHCQNLYDNASLPWVSIYKMAIIKNVWTTFFGVWHNFLCRIYVETYLELYMLLVAHDVKLPCEHHGMKMGPVPISSHPPATSHVPFIVVGCCLMVSLEDSSCRCPSPMHRRCCLCVYFPAHNSM